MPTKAGRGTAESVWHVARRCLAIINRLQQVPEARYIPIVALTANVSEEMMRECMIAGCMRVLHKPISRYTLLDAIRSIGEQAAPAPADGSLLNDADTEKHKSVLIVEDNQDLRTIFARAFHPSHYAVQVAEDGVTALKLLEAELPDIMILDTDMPRLSGLDVLQYVRNNQQLKHVKTIVVTGNLQAVHMPEANYADLLLTKPIDISDLIALAQRLTAVPT